MTRPALLAALLLLGSAGEAAPMLACSEPAWRLVYRHDADGKPIAGAKAALFDAIRRGDPVRIAWGGSFAMRDGTKGSVEHSADPVFISIMGGSEVVAQTPEHLGQSAYHDAAAARFDASAGMWRGMFSTSGRFDAIFVDRGTGKEIRRLPQRAAVAWFAFAPDPACDTRPPLTLAIEGGVRRDAAPAATEAGRQP